MEEFPFSETDWQRVSDASMRITNACLADDEPLHASLLIEFGMLLDELRDKYGCHPVLDETEADYADDPGFRLTKYREALRVTVDEGFPTLSIRISLAGLLIDEFNNLQAAATELKACKGELLDADDYDVEQWNELMAKCSS